MDYASATPILSQALRALESSSQIFGNPGSIHSEGVKAKKSLDDSRHKIAAEIGCKAREVIFVSGGTEANNLAILGAFEHHEKIGSALQGTHWIVSAIEHPSVLECFSEIERRGGNVSHVMPNEKGLIDVEPLSLMLRKETVFVSIGWANHEIGVVQPIADLVRAVRNFEKKENTNILFHSDAGQAPLYISPQVHTLGVDLFSLDSGKLYGPRGIGAFYLSNRAEIAPVIHGGGQERGLRAGTENVALAAGFAEAFYEVGKERERESKRLLKLRDYFAAGLKKHINGLHINGELSHALPHMLNISIRDISSEYMTLALDKAGIAVATKSACREGEERQSHVVEALTKDQDDLWRARNTLRFSLGKYSIQSDIDFAVAALGKLLSHS